MTKFISNTSSLLFMALMMIFSTQAIAQTNKNNMKVTAPQAAPTFSVKDVNGATVNLADYKGKKVLISFFRNVGCPVCNLRFHELENEAAYFKSKGLVVLAVYESSADNMKQYLEGENFYATMLPNADQSLYQLYDIDKSMGKMMKGMFHGAMGKMGKGKKLFKQKIKQDGNSNRITADFLIDEKGNIQTAHYSKYLGDDLSIDKIKQFLN
jgi:thioredoxin-dependent peroxiredoxin